MLGARRLSLERRKRVELLEILEIEALNYLKKGFVVFFFFSSSSIIKISITLHDKLIRELTNRKLVTVTELINRKVIDGYKVTDCRELEDLDHSLNSKNTSLGAIRLPSRARDSK